MRERRGRVGIFTIFDLSPPSCPVGASVEWVVGGRVRPVTGTCSRQVPEYLRSDPAFVDLYHSFVFPSPYIQLSDVALREAIRKQMSVPMLLLV